MQTNAFQVWGIRLATLVLAALAALSATFWALKSTHANSVPTAAAAGFSVLDPQALARALGGGGVAAPAGAPISPNTAYVLVGVLADRLHGGAALIAIDGKAAKPYRVGATVDTNLVLQSVVGRRAVLAPSLEGPAQVTLELPPLSK
ncbi:MAG: type II secretion system protein N [Rhodoferax sp.]